MVLPRTARRGDAMNHDRVPPIRGLVRTDTRAVAAYAEAGGVHRIIPSLIARPVDAADLQTLVRWAIDTGTPLTARGAGSSMGGGAVGTGCLVDLRDLPRVLEIDVANRTARVSANITLAELAAVAAPHGLHFPPDPSSRAWATVGGVIATNAAGPRTVRDGAVRSWVEAVTFVDGRADLVTLARGTPTPLRHLALHETIRAERQRIRQAFPATSKNTCGYALDHAGTDLLHVLIGAEGTLGIVTEATLSLAPIAAAQLSLRLILDDLDQLTETIALLLPHRPAAVELLERSFLEIVAPQLAPALANELQDAAAVLLVDLEADDTETLHRQRDGISHALEGSGVALRVAATPIEAAELWALRHAASPILAGLGETRRSVQIIEDGCVPVPQLAAYIRAVRAACDGAGVPCVLFGHAGDGHVHVNLLPSLEDPEWRARITQIYAEVGAAVLRLGGTPSGEHGDGRLRAPLVSERYPDDILVLFARVKQGFDPHGVLNPGVILDQTGADPLASLKVGLDAAPIPGDIADALRHIERERGWATDRLTLADTPR